jgi:hypothetical protein
MKNSSDWGSAGILPALSGMLPDEKDIDALKAEFKEQRR